MIWLLSTAFACDPEAAMGTLAGGPGELKDAYFCVMESERGRDLLVAAIDAAPAPSNEPIVVSAPGDPVPTANDADMATARANRGLALWLLHRADAPWDPALVRRLPAKDRRLLSDGVRARRGRTSPAPEHAKVFAQFSWYRPEVGYTESRLSPGDLANILLADRPPAPAPAPVPIADAPVVEVAAGESALCGCGASGGRVGWWGAIAALTLAVRSRSVVSAATPTR